MLTAKPLDVLTHIRHGFFTREGGVSKGIYASLNCGYGSDDDTENVRENRARIAEKLSVEREKLLTVYQVHSPTVALVTEPWTPDTAPQADAMVTATPGIALGILTADCTPILFADPQAGVIGAAHAGWRGAAEGIALNTIAAMVALGADPARIRAAIGPTISGPNYEVGDQFRTDLLAITPDGAPFFTTPEGGKPHFDLPGFVQAQLRAAGIAPVENLGICTYAAPERYFSHRYATHQQTKAGRQIAVIAMT